MQFENTSGLEPVGMAVLVRPYEPEKPKSMIELPPAVRSAIQMLEQRAVVIAVGDACWHDEPGDRAYPGDHVLITRYAGFMVSSELSADGQEYRLVTDRDVFCRLKEKENG